MTHSPAMPKYWVFLPYNSIVHHMLLLQSGLPCKGTEKVVGFTFDTLTDQQSDLLIQYLKN